MNRYFENIIIIEDNTTLKTISELDFLPKTNNLIYIDKKRYQVTSNVFDYDLKEIRIYVARA